MKKVAKTKKGTLKKYLQGAKQENPNENK